MPQTLQPKFAGIRRQIARPGVQADVRRALTEWRNHTRGGFVDVTRRGSLETWLRFFAACHVPVSRIVVRIDDSRQELKDEVELSFATVAGALPAIESVCGGYGRPAAYLLISSQPLRAGEVASSAATSMAGFHTLMLAATVRMDIGSELET
jgi:hypothetical protein